LSGPSPGDESRLFHYRVTGTGFLRHMVRTIVGTLVEIGGGRWPPDEIARILESRDRARAGATAPAHGLVLMRVHY
jgi:tRNA pseudouridine38-40 synthase